jgi:hypothetical protein
MNVSYTSGFASQLQVKTIVGTSELSRSADGSHDQCDPCLVANWATVVPTRTFHYFNEQ